MKDLDFDELDQAVNSLMTGVPRMAEPKGETAGEKTLTITPTLQADERPSFTALEQAATLAAADLNTRPEPLPVPSLVARRSSGRFMDVVHPSSDMKINNRPVVSRVGLQLNPVPSRPSVIETPAPVVEVATPSPASEVVEWKPTPMNDWPDPIAMEEAEDTELAKAPETSAAVSEPSVVTTSVDTEEPSPLLTPFLTDTKVEKRPLGAFAVGLHSTVDDTPSDVEASTNEPEEQPSADLPDEAPGLPDELHHELMQIESDASDTNDSPEVMTPPTFSAPVVTAVPQPAGPTSIQPQYKEEPSSAEEKHAGIYDTESYHQPLSHPGKKKSGWLWVLWIVLLLAAGAGGALALYYFNII